MLSSNTDSTMGGRFVKHSGPVTCVAGVPGSDLVVSSAYDGAVACFDLSTGSVELIGYHDHLVNKITVRWDGSKAASSSSDYTVRIWDLTTRKLECILHGHSDDVEDFVFVNNHVGVSVSRDWRIIVWNLESGAIARRDAIRSKALQLGKSGKATITADQVVKALADAGNPLDVARPATAVGAVLRRMSEFKRSGKSRFKRVG